MSLKRQRESEDDNEIFDETNKEQINDIRETSINSQSKSKSKSKLKSKSKSKANSELDTSITCNLPPLCSREPQTFDNFQQYELHYVTNHTNNCSECKKNFPSSKLLDLHIAENHDPFIKIKLQKGEPVFGCFVENCDRLFKDHKKRRLHLIYKHDYPKDYIFSIVDRGIRQHDTSLIKKNTKSYGIWKPA